MTIEDRIVDAIGAHGIEATKLREQFQLTREATWAAAMARLVRDWRVSVNGGKVRRVTERGNA